MNITKYFVPIVMGSLAKSNRRFKLISINIFFFTLLLLGLNIYRDYGISWDEPISRANGMITLHHLGEKLTPSLIPRDKELVKFNTPLNKYADRDYGIAFDAPVSFLERVFHIEDTREIYMFRHLLTFFVFVGGVFAVFRLGERRFLDWRLGLLAAFFLVLSPRFFAESFYNNKDIVFMAFFAIAMNANIAFILKPSIRGALLGALASAVAIDVRIMAVVLPVLTLFMLLIRLQRSDFSWRTLLPEISLYYAVLVLSVLALWPWLWSSPLTNFLQAFANMANFRWPGSVLYMGSHIKASELPWHYIPVWIAITTPILYLPFFLLGVLVTVRQFLNRRFFLWKGESELQDFFFLGLFAGPLIAVIVLHSVLYDGWRQMYFIYPAFILITLKGLMVLWKVFTLRSSYKPIFFVLMIFTLSHTAIWMVKAHPFQNVYFNSLAGRDWKNHFEVDYWGLSNRQALEYILKHDSHAIISVYPGSNTPINNSLLMLRREDRLRLRVVHTEVEADYIVNNFRDYSPVSLEERGFMLLYVINVNQEVILSIFKKTLLK